MDLIIKDLKEDYPLVYEAALISQEDQGNNRNDKLYLYYDQMQGGFDWDKSQHGDDFWNAIDERRFSDAKKICPSLFP